MNGNTPHWINADCILIEQNKIKTEKSEAQAKL